MYMQKDFETAREMIDYLSPLDTTRWPRAKYVFRGQQCTSYGLVPAAYRTKGPLAAHRVFNWLAPLASRQVYYELSLLGQFIAACDASGTSLPGDSLDVRDILKDQNRYIHHEPISWPPRELYPLLATAQHHGAPTCLLDWTWRSYVAAYFAASGALQHETQDRLAIWALNVEHRHLWENLSFIEMPGSTSANLAAQSGIFTVSTIKATEGEQYESTALENQADIYRDQTEAQPGLIKMTLPVLEAGHLLLLCADLGVKGSVLFPGYEGAAREVKDFAYLMLQ